MKKENQRRNFLKTLTLGGMGLAIPPSALTQPAGRSPTPEQVATDQPTPEQAATGKGPSPTGRRKYNAPNTGEYLSRLAFPIGGIGAGMICLEGTGAISHLSVRNRPEIYNEPGVFAALSVKRLTNGAKILEGPVPDWKYFGPPGTGNGASGTSFGLPRYSHAEFVASFPFGEVRLRDDDIPVEGRLIGWSPFIPTDEDNSSLPAGALEYHFVNRGKTTIEAVFSYNAKNFLASGDEVKNSIGELKGGFVLQQEGSAEKPWLAGSFAIFTDDTAAVVDHCWFRGGWWDPLTMAWNTVRDAKTRNTAPVDKEAPGASLFVPFSLAPGASRTIRVMMAWYVPASTLHIGDENPSAHYSPWYSSRFGNIRVVTDYWRANYADLFHKTTLFSDAFHASTLPPEVMEAVAANLTILKSPTVLRQSDGRLWSWEGCGDDAGCCHGSCTHVWNYAQAMPHLFPALERSLRNTEFNEDQNSDGHHRGFNRANDASSARSNTIFMPRRTGSSAGS